MIHAVCGFQNICTCKGKCLVYLCKLSCHILTIYHSWKNLTLSYIHAGALHLWRSQGNGSSYQEIVFSPIRRVTWSYYWPVLDLEWYILVQDGFIPNIIHMESFCHQRWKIISMKKSVWKSIHQGPGNFWLPSDINNIGIGTSERNFKEYKHVQIVQRSRMQNDSAEKRAILYGTEKMHKKSIMGKICV